MYDEVFVVKNFDTDREFSYLCQKSYDYPDQKLKVLEITDTDGKISTATIMQVLLVKNTYSYPIYISAYAGVGEAYMMLKVEKHIRQNLFK